MIVSGVAGRFSPDTSSDLHASTTDALASREHPDDRVKALDGPGLAATVRRGWVLQDDELYCCVSGSLDWLDLGFADVQLKRDPAHAVLRAYRSRGKELLSVIGGRFALAIWDRNKRNGLLAVDRFAQLPLYWHQDAQGDLLFAPTTTLIRQLSRDKPSLSDQALYNYLFYHMVPAPDSIYQGINKLLAGHALCFENGKPRVVRYWRPDFREHMDTSMSAAGDELLGLLTSSVANLARGADTGAFLSGGFDSSTVTGLLARRQPHPTTYSIGFDAAGYDEIAYARIASEYFGTQFRTYYVTPDDVLRQLPRVAAAYDEPFGNSSALPVYFCARKAAEDGRERLLGGDGGDEIFAGNQRYARQRLFNHYAGVPRLWRRWLIEPLLGKLATDRKGLLAKAQSYVRQANVPLPERLHTYNFLVRFGMQQVLNPEFAAAVDTNYPMQLDRTIYDTPKDASPLNRMLYLDWQRTLADNDLRKVTRMCELAGIEVAFPMLDDRLVEFSTRVSSPRKMRHGQLRYFYRRAMRGFLPQELLDKPKHGFGLPFGVWLAEHPGLQQLASDNLARLRRRRLLRPDLLEQIVRQHREQHASYFGEFIWVLMMLELWLTAQGHEP